MSDETNQHLAGDNFECIFLNENVRLMEILLEFVPTRTWLTCANGVSAECELALANDKSALVQVLAWLQAGDKPLHYLKSWTNDDPVPYSTIWRPSRVIRQGTPFTNMV